MRTSLDCWKRQRVCPSKSKACAYAWGNGRDCGAGKDCYVRAKGRGPLAKLI
nr:MAG TPA: spider toxin pi-hexatoxin-Hi1a toxin, Inhibitor cystine knot [Caudoviricetes sp.]